MGDGPLPETRLAPVHRYEDLLAAAPESFDWPALDENQAAGMRLVGQPHEVLLEVARVIRQGCRVDVQINAGRALTIWRLLSDRN